MTKLYESIQIIKEQLNNILENMGADTQQLSLDWKKIENEFGGNSEITVTFNAEINHIPYKTMKFRFHPEIETEENFINEIRSYMFCVLDGVANL